MVMLALPVQAVLRLKRCRRERFGLVLVFSLGAFVCVTSIVRAPTLATSSIPKDVTWDPIPATIWSVIECNTGIICACLPMIRQPLSIVFAFLTTADSNNRSRAGSLSFPPQRVNTNGLSRATHPAHSASLTSTWIDIDMTDDDFQNRMSPLPSSARDERVSPNDSEAGMIWDDAPKIRKGNNDM